MTSNDVRFAQAYAKLIALRDTLPEGRACLTSTGLAIVPPVWVEQFENLLEVLEETLGVSLQAFRPNATSKTEWYDRDVLKMKIEGVINFLDSAQEKTPQIGFRP